MSSALYGFFTDAASERRCAFFGIFACEHGDNIISAFKCFVAKRAKSIGSGFAYIGCDKAYTAYLLCIFHKVGSFRCCNLCLQRRYFAFLFFKLRRESRGTGRQFMIICKLKVFGGFGNKLIALVNVFHNIIARNSLYSADARRYR